MEFLEWIASHDGVVHRHAARPAGVTDEDVAAAVKARTVQVVRRHWLVTSGAADELVAAAKAGGRVSCLTLARRRGWWMPDDADERRHLSMQPHARRGAVDVRDVVHWTKAVAPTSAHQIEESAENALAHLARCASRESALAIWESAVRKERLSVTALQNVKWTTPAARELAAELTGLSDSGLETIFRVRLGPWGLAIRQQVILAGRPVDFVIGEWLVVQVDGYSHHSSAAQRGRDVAHDAELRLRGYTVLRFTYAHVLYDWPAVERTIARALAAGLHLTPRQP